MLIVRSGDGTMNGASGLDCMADWAIPMEQSGPEMRLPIVIGSKTNQIPTVVWVRVKLVV